MLVSSGLVFGMAFFGDWLGVWDFRRFDFFILMGILLVGSIVISTVIVYVFGNSVIFRSLRKLRDASTAIAQGDFTSQLKVPREREVGDLVESFNHMTRELGKQEMLASDFIANVSHEFKNPLSAIQGYAQLLEDDSLQRDKRNQYIQLISDKTTTLSTLVSNILELSKLDNRNSRLTKQNFSLDEQIRQSILMLEGKWSTKNIEFELFLPDTTYFGNQHLISQVWQNLIDNAVKFSHEGGHIAVALSNHDDSVTVRVVDSGIGMDNETQKHLFDKFYQNDHSVITGNGLGLSIAKRIVELHNGTIRAESYPSIGTTMIVTLPL